MNGKKPHTWLRHLEGRFDDTMTLLAKLYRFTKSLERGQKAEKWFQALPVWKNVVLAGGVGTGRLNTEHCSRRDVR
jgi:hypothetical protein